MDNLVLIGMPGCGKSTAGVLIAKKLGYDFIDSDLLIQKREKALLCEIIAREGVEGFISIENAVNASIECERSIVATGGSVIYGEEAMAHLASIGTVIYFKLPYETIYERVGEIVASRGVVIRSGETLKELYEERVPLYEKYAQYTVDCEGMTIDQTVEHICALYKQTVKTK